MNIQTANYSERRLMAGLDAATFIAWAIIVARAITKAKNPAGPNTHHL